jgi:hypothetical protein
MCSLVVKLVLVSAKSTPANTRGRSRRRNRERPGDRTMSSVLYDAVLIADGENSVSTLVGAGARLLVRAMLPDGSMSQTETG